MAVAGTLVNAGEFLHSLVAAVTQWLLGGVFAATEKYLGRFRRFVAHRGEAGILVRAIAKRLAGAESTGAPEIGFAGFYFHAEGCVCCSLGFLHGSLLTLYSKVGRPRLFHSTGLSRLVVGFTLSIEVAHAD